MKHTRQQSGFTLIELIIVIVILGILAVTAAPKFLDIQGDAKASIVRGMEGAMQSASDIIHAKSLLDGTNSSASATLTLNSGDTVATDYGYARHDWNTAWVNMLDANIEVLNSGSCTSDFCVDASQDISTDLTTAGVTSDSPTNALIIYPNGTTNTGACYAYYTHDESATAEGTEPVLGSITTGC
jgi:MSHA pilin protein MshA